MWNKLKEGITIIGNGSSFNLLTDDEINYLNRFPIFRCNHFYKNKNDKIRKDIWGFFYGIFNKELKQNINKLNIKYACSPVSLTNNIERINVWNIIKENFPELEKNYNLNVGYPTSGMNMLAFAVLNKPKVINITGIDFYKTEYSYNDLKYNAYDDKKTSHNEKSDLCFLRTSIKYANKHNIEIKIFHNEWLKKLIESYSA